MLHPFTSPPSRTDETATPRGTEPLRDPLVVAEPSEIAIEQIRPLLDAAARLDLLDRDGWDRLRDAARTRFAVLIAGGQLPKHLAIAPDTPPVVVTRSIAAAWRHVTAAPTRRARSR